ncbi:MAG TPA: hypothetical protein VNX26_12875 [Candidatus Acidoferrum sp.]|nr:hypothetical protein [Candidatus Acidoferrum sp.]
MRPASSRVVTLWITVLCLLAALPFNDLATAQAAGSKHKLSQKSLLSGHPVVVGTVARRTMRNGPLSATTDTWTGGGGSNTDWSDASNWNNGAITTGENIVIGTTTAATTIGVSEFFNVGTVTLSNAGDSVTIANNGTLEASGNISNAGTITFNAAGNVTGLFINNPLTLSGSGSIVLTSSNGQYTGTLYGTTGAILTTSSNITGAGTVGNGELNFVNSGTMNANQNGLNLLVNPDPCGTCTNTNTGTLEATNGGVLTLSNGTWTNTGGTIKASGTGSAVNLQSGVSITGGTLTTSSGGVINDVASNAVFLTNVTNSGNYVVQNNGATEISGTLTNTGTMTMNAAGNVTELYLTGNTTLSGSGTVVLSSSNNQWTGQVSGVSGMVLTNQSTITGWGAVGTSTLQIANASNGVINSNLSGGNIEVSPLGTVTSTNAGLMEATNGGTLTMNAGTWTNTGTIEAATGSSVVLTGGVSITGGTIESVGTGTVINAVSNNVFLTGLTLAGTYDIQNNAATEINGTITNNGVINLQAAGNITELYVTAAGSGSATLTGTGTIVLGTGTGNQFSGASGTSLTIDQGVSGVGNIGTGLLTLTNNSTIDANISPTVSTIPLTIQPGTGGMINTHILEATNGGNLTLAGGSINNAGGTIEALGSDTSSNPSTVVLTSNVTITGGTLTTTGAGIIEVASSNNANLTGLTNSGTLNVQNNGEIVSSGTITNNGTITLQAAGNQTYFYAPSATTLSGSGTLVMGSTNGQYTGNVDAQGGLTNGETITGAGQIDTGSFTNNGTVNANVSGQVLLLQSLTTATNTNTMEATNGGTMVFNGSIWTNTGGTITAQTGSAVELTGNTTITGGTLNSVGTGQVFILAGNTANLTGLTNSGTLNVQNNGQLISSGTITNNGTITLQAAGNQTFFYAPSATTLSGSGTLVMGSTNGQYTGNVDAQGGLTNGETITGAGQIDTGSFTNNGTVNANVSGQTLLLQSLTTAINTKTMEATNGGTMEFNGTNWTNTGGTISAQNGSAVELTGNASITGGTLTTSGTGQIFVLSSNNAFLSGLTNSGTINVQNNSQLELTGAITNSGTITLQAAGNTTYLLINGAVTLNGSGIVNLSSTNNSYTNQIYGVGTTPTLTSFNTIEGAGNLGSSNMGFTNNGTLDANVAGLNLAINVNSSGFTNYNGTNFTLTGGTYIANSGNITFASGGTTGITTLSANVTEENGGQILDTSNSNANALAKLTSITSTGALTIGGVAFVDAGSFSNTGSLTILSGESFTVGSLTQISGGSLTAGTYVLDANLNLSGAAQTITTNATNLTLAGGTIHNNSGGTNALAGLAFNTKNLTIAGSSNNVTTTAASFSNTGTLTINGSDSFTAGNLTQISSGTLTAGTYVLGGNLDLTTAGISITKNSTTLTLQGGTINSNGVNALSALATNTSKLTIAGSANNVSTSAASFSNTGTLTINSGDSFTASKLTQISGTTLTAGTYVLSGNLDLTTSGISITTNSATLTLSGGTIKSNGVNTLSALASNTKSLTIAGTSNNISTTASSFSNTGTLTINSGDSFTAPALTQISGSTLTAGTYVLAGNLDLTASANITTNSANLTLEGGSIKTGSTNDLANLATNTGTLTLASNASFTAVGNFTNSGALTVNKGSTFTLTGSNVLTNLSAGTLASGTYTVGGTLQLTSANGGITTNAANLTLTGTAAKINDGTSNALSGFATNTGTFALASSATFTTGGNFTDSGTVTIAKGTKLTIGGTNKTYTQTAGTTNLDGTLAGGNATVTGGLFQGAGTVSKNLTIGGGGTAPTLNVGDAGKTGLLAITGTYTQLSTGTMTGLINGTTAGSGFSQLNVTGTAALAGTINFTVAAGFQGSLFNGETFTVLTSSGLTGTFSNTTIAININFHFNVSYTATGVVLTVATGAAPNTGSPAQPVAQITASSVKPVAAVRKGPVLSSGLRHHVSVVGKTSKPILVARIAPSSGRSNAILARGSEFSNLRSWERMPVVSTGSVRPIAVAVTPRVTNTNSSRIELSKAEPRMGQNHLIGVQSPLAGWMGNTTNRRTPAKILPPMLPRITR